MATQTRRRRRTEATGHTTSAITPRKPRVYVLDTNVLMHDPSSIFRFEENDVLLPITVIEELDDNKKGQSEVARNSRQVIRYLNEIVKGSPVARNSDGLASFPLAKKDARATGMLHIESRRLEFKDESGALDPTKADNHILLTALYLKETVGDKDVILVTKDLGVSVKANILGLTTQDYESDKVVEDADVLPRGIHAITSSFWDGLNVECTPKASHQVYTIPRSGLARSIKDVRLNEFIIEDNETKPFRARVTRVDTASVELTTVLGHYSKGDGVFGIRGRNHEQDCALELLIDPDVYFITLLGQAGTGKTLLTLAAGLEQVAEKKIYNQIIFTRATVPIGEDIGFLPGTEEEKMGPWMGALDDNLEVLIGDAEKEKPDTFTRDSKFADESQKMVLKRWIKVKSMNFMRGRTFINKFVIIDEAQNLSPKQMKTLLTRAGPGTKIVCLGNIAQIDTPYLTEGSSGLSYAVERFRNGDDSLPFGWKHSGHLILPKPVRSSLASQAEKVM